MRKEAIVKCRLLCGWETHAGKPVMETLGAIHERNAHEAGCIKKLLESCRGGNPPARTTLTTSPGSDRMHPTHE